MKKRRARQHGDRIVDIELRKELADDLKVGGETVIAYQLKNEDGDNVRRPQYYRARVISKQVERVRVFFKLGRRVKA